MTGSWQRDIPVKNGKYWAATRGGYITGPLSVIYDQDGKLLAAGNVVGSDSWSVSGHFQGWWWSEPIEEPPPPPEW